MHGLNLLQGGRRRLAFARRCGRRLVAGAWLVLFGFGLFASRASAHSLLPYGLSLVWATEDAAELPLIVTDRGLVFADLIDGQLRFSLRCSEAYEATATPPVILRAGGTLTIGLYHGVYRSSDRACTLQAGAGLPDQPIGNVVRTSGAPGSLLVPVPTIEDGGVLVSQDDGQHWTERFLFPANEYYDDLVPAPSAPERLYASGVRVDQAAKTVTFLCSVSRDAGASWAHHAHATRIAPFGVHPQDPEVVFAYEPTDRLETEFRILRSTDGCATFTPVLEGLRKPTAIAMNGDGSSVWIGSSYRGQGGLYRSSDGGLHFEHILAETVWHVSCLYHRQGRLWMCANLAPNVDGVWYSDDQSASFEKFLTFDQVSEPVACPGEAQQICDAPWADFERELHSARASDAGAGVDPDGGGASPFDAGEHTPDTAANDGSVDEGAVQPGAFTKRRAAGCHMAAFERSGVEGAIAWLSLAALLVGIVRRSRG